MSLRDLLSRSGIVVAAAVLIGSIGIAPAVAQDDSSATIGGVVTADGSGLAVANALVTVSWFGGQGSTTVATDAMGSYEISGVPTSTVASFPAGTELSGLVQAPHGAWLLDTGFPTQTPLAAGEHRTVNVSLIAMPAVASEVPTLTGTAVVGGVLRATPGAWDPTATLTYIWSADGVPIPGASGAALTLGAAQDGKRITVAVTGSSVQHAPTTRTSHATLKVMRASTPKISGSAAHGATLTANVGTWSSKTQLATQWYANDTAISGATGTTYKVTSAQRDRSITVRVTGKQSGYPTVSRTSPATTKVIVAGSSSIAGAAVAGSTLTAKHSAWTSGTRLDYRWYANGVAISGATKATFKIASTEAGKSITVRITGKKAGYTTVTKGSASTKKVAIAGTPFISGTAKVSKTLTAKRGTWTSGTTFTYKWYANGKAINGAKKNTLKLTDAVKGKRISVKVTGKKPGYTTVTRTSKATATVLSAPKPPARRCDSNYSGACVPIASDVDCAGGSGNGPAYVQGPVYVIGSDIYDLDRDGDGVACE